MGRKRNKQSAKPKGEVRIGRRLLPPGSIPRGGGRRKVVPKCPTRERKLCPKGSPYFGDNPIVLSAKPLTFETLPDDDQKPVYVAADECPQPTAFLPKGQKPLPPFQPPSCTAPSCSEVATTAPASDVGAGGQFVQDVLFKHNFSPTGTAPSDPPKVTEESRRSPNASPTVDLPFQAGFYPESEEPLPLSKDEIERSIFPRKLVQVSFEDASRAAQQFTAAFDPDSDVSFATREMIVKLGKKSWPWKHRSYHTMIGVLSPLQFSELRTEAHAIGVDGPFPLRVAILEGPCFFGDFCFGRAAIDQMMLQYPEFKKQLRSLCGSLCDSLDRSPDDDHEDTMPKGEVVNDGISRSSPPLLQLGTIPTFAGHRTKLPITPPLSQCTTSEGRYVAQPASNPFTSSPLFPMNMETKPIEPDWAGVYTPTSQPAVSQAEQLRRFQQLSPFSDTGNFFGHSQAPMPITVSQPHLSVGYQTMNPFQLPGPFPSLPGGMLDDNSLQDDMEC